MHVVLFLQLDQSKMGQSVRFRLTVKELDRAAAPLLRNLEALLRLPCRSAFQLEMMLRPASKSQSLKGSLLPTLMVVRATQLKLAQLQKLLNQWLHRLVKLLMVLSALLKQIVRVWAHAAVPLPRKLELLLAQPNQYAFQQDLN